jgi:UrcA family protein
MRTITTLAAIVAVGAIGTATAADQKIEQVRVEASKIVSTKAGSTYSGIPVKNISLSYEVSLDDLDLATSAGLIAAEKRVNNAAAAACKEINKQEPLAPPADESCAKTAANKAIAQLHASIAGTGKNPNK